MFFILLYNPRLLSPIIYSIVDEIKINKGVYYSHILPFRSLMSKKKVMAEVEEEKPPLLALWITKAWRFIKSPKEEIRRFLFGVMINNAIKEATPLFSKDDILKLIHKAQEKQSELGNVMLQLSSNLTNENDCKNMKELAELIIKDSEVEIDDANDFNKNAIAFMREYMNNQEPSI